VTSLSHNRFGTNWDPTNHETILLITVVLLAIHIAALYLGLMLLNVVFPTGLTSARGLFNSAWITLLMMVIIAVVGAVYFLIARPDRKVAGHLHDQLEPTRAERH